MKRSILTLALTLLAIVAGTRGAGAQATERPEPFDSAGRVTVITPSIAARLELSPPAWRVTGDFAGARLYSTGDSGYVLVVERRDGSAERYALTRQDREYLRARTSTLAVTTEQKIERITTGLGEVRSNISQAVRSDAFVYNQAGMALLVYGPSFAYALSDQTAGRIAAYVLGAGGTFYAATQVARNRPITGPMNLLSSHAGIHGAAAGLGIAYGTKANSNVQGAATFVGGVAGTMLGLRMGQNLRNSEVAGAIFGADASALTAYLLTQAAHERGTDYPSRGEAFALAASTLVGYPLGIQYAKRARYNVTAGDVGALWATGVTGGLSAYTIAHAITKPEGDNPSTSERDKHRMAVHTSAAVGFLVGAAAGDYLLVRRFDHTTREAGIVIIGAAGGALMGAGAQALIDPKRSGTDTGPYVAATLGSVVGIALAEAFMPPRPDAGRRTSSRVELHPSAVAMAASRAPGNHSFVTIRF